MPSSSTINPETATLAGLSEYIVATHHEYCRRELPLIAQELAAARKAADDAELRRLEAGFQHLTAALVRHFSKEESLLFPLIVAIEKALDQHTPPPGNTFGSVGNPIQMMVLEHGEAEVLLFKLRESTRNFEAPAGAPIAVVALYARLRAFDADMRRHVELEDKYLFPRAIDAEKAAAHAAGGR